MTERKTPLRRRRKQIALLSLIVAVATGVPAFLNLAAAALPPSTKVVAVPIAPPPSPLSSEPLLSWQEISFETPSLDANTTLNGTVTLCCLHTMPRSLNGLTYFSPPQLYILSQNDYIAMKATKDGNPTNSHYEAAILEENFNNYTFNGPTGTELLWVQFTTSEPGAYYFFVELTNAETHAQLNLTYYENETVENSLASPIRLILGLVSIGSSCIAVYVEYRRYTESEKVY